jgi:ADP-heptose:LPS heptosyltransferase
MPFALTNQECLTARLSALGDAVLTTGVLHYWHERAGLSFQVLTRPALAPIFRNHPAVRRLILVEKKDMSGRAWWSFCRKLRRSHGHLPFLDLHDNLRTRVLRLLWPSTVRTYRKYSVLRRLFLAARRPFVGNLLRRHNVPQRYAMTLEKTPPVAHVLRPLMFLEAEEHDAAQRLLSRLGPNKPVAIHPYATHPAKSPAPTIWLEVIRLLDAAGHSTVIIGRNDAPLMPGAAQDLTNKTDLRITAAVLARCACLITGDSGPMHLATAVGTPVAALFGPTTAEWGFYPSGPKDKVLQIPCPDAPCSLHGQDACTRGNACMTDLSTEQILSLARSVLES